MKLLKKFNFDKKWNSHCSKRTQVTDDRVLMDKTAKDLAIFLKKNCEKCYAINIDDQLMWRKRK